MLLDSRHPVAIISSSVCHTECEIRVQTPVGSYLFGRASLQELYWGDWQQRDNIFCDLDILRALLQQRLYPKVVNTMMMMHACTISTVLLDVSSVFRVMHKRYKDTERKPLSLARKSTLAYLDTVRDFYDGCEVFLEMYLSVNIAIVMNRSIVSTEISMAYGDTTLTRAELQQRVTDRCKVYYDLLRCAVKTMK